MQINKRNIGILAVIDAIVLIALICFAISTKSWIVWIAFWFYFVVEICAVKKLSHYIKDLF